jgi:O-antigen ligase
MQQEVTLRTHSFSKAQTGHGAPFYLTLVYLMLEYGRPQEIIPGLGALHLPMIIILLLGAALVGSGRLNLSDPQAKLYSVLLVLMAVHVPFATNNYWAFHTTKDMLIMFGPYLAIIGFVDSFQKFRIMVNTWIGVHIYLAITGLMQGGKGIGGFLGDENDFALALNMAIPYGFFMALESKTTLKRIIFLVITGTFVVCNVATLSRGGFVGLVAVGLYCWIRSPRKILSMFGIVVLIFAMSHFAPEEYWEQVQSIQEERDKPDSTGNDRIYSWKAGWKMFLDNPVLGVGPGNFPWNFEKYETEGFAGRLHGGRAAHSLYFTLIPELGSVGVIIFLLMLNNNRKTKKEILKLEKSKKDTLLMQMDSNLNEKEKILLLNDKDKQLLTDLKKAHYFTLALDGSLIGYLVSGTFISVLYYPSLWLLFAFTTALKRSVSNRISEWQI